MALSVSSSTTTSLQRTISAVCWPPVPASCTRCEYCDITASQHRHSTTSSEQQSAQATRHLFMPSSPADWTTAAACLLVLVVSRCRWFRMLLLVS